MKIICGREKHSWFILLCNALLIFNFSSESYPSLFQPIDGAEFSSEMVFDNKILNCDSGSSSKWSVFI